MSKIAFLGGVGGVVNILFWFDFFFVGRGDGGRWDGGMGVVTVIHAFGVFT